MSLPQEKPEENTNPEPLNNEQNEIDKINSAEESYLAKVFREGLVEDSSVIENMRNDPNSPLYSAKTFDELNLNENLLKAIYDMGFEKPSKIQETALPILLENPPKNLIAQAQSGTGKTAAFSLAMLSRVDPAKKHPQVLCILPTFELSKQIGKVVQDMLKYSPNIQLKLSVLGENVRRGTPIKEQVIIGTPGKIIDWGIKFRLFDLKKIKVCVLDEADVMVDLQGLLDHCIKIYKNLDPNCQMLLFSATYSDEILKIAELLIKNSTIIRLKREEETLSNIKQYYVECLNRDDKYKKVLNIYGLLSVGQAIIFCQVKKTAYWLSTKMANEGLDVLVLTGDIDLEIRKEVVNRFRSGESKILVTTNILARGIDFPSVNLVINYDLPLTTEGQADCQTYLHRIGRSGRFGRKGITINLLDSPKSKEICKEIESHFGKKIEHLNAEDDEEIEKLIQ